MVLPRPVLVLVVALAGATLGCKKTSTEGSSPLCHDEPFSNEVCIGEGSLPGESPFAPEHKVTLQSFFIDVNPISNAEHKACFDARACPDECQLSTTSPCQGPFAQA